MDSKGQGIGLNTIILAAIGVLVLVVIVFLVVNATGNVTEAQNCLDIDGASCEPSCGQYGESVGRPYVRNPSATGCSSGTVCCIPVGIS